MVADNKSGKRVSSKVRTSSGTFVLKGQDEIIAAIEARIAAWTFLPLGIYVYVICYMYILVMKVSFVC